MLCPKCGRESNGAKRCPICGKIQIRHMRSCTQPDIFAKMGVKRPAVAGGASEEKAGSVGKQSDIAQRGGDVRNRAAFPGSGRRAQVVSPRRRKKNGKLLLPALILCAAVIGILTLLGVFGHETPQEELVPAFEKDEPAKTDGAEEIAKEPEQKDSAVWPPVSDEEKDPEVFRSEEKPLQGADPKRGSPFAADDGQADLLRGHDDAEIQTPPVQEDGGAVEFIFSEEEGASGSAE